jgi:hypothetical protein
VSLDPERPSSFVMSAVWTDSTRRSFMEAASRVSGGVARVDRHVSSNDEGVSTNMRTLAKKDGELS